MKPISKSVPKLATPPRAVPVPRVDEAKTVTARMSPIDCARLDALADAMHKAHHGWGKANRSDAFRTVIVAGLDALEPKFGIKTAKVGK